MGERRVILDGFEGSLVSEIAASFHFDGAEFDGYVLAPGRHLFVSDMPSAEGIAKTAGSTPPYDPVKEPTISFYNEGGASVGPSASWGSRHEWNLRVVIRFGTVFEKAKALLEALVAWLEREMKGRRVGRHQVKGVVIVNRPSPFQRTGDAQAYCSATLRFLAVPLP